MSIVTIVPSVLKNQVEEGMKLKELASFYGLPETQMKKALQAQGLKIRKFHAPKFVFLEEEQNEVQEVVEIENIPTLTETVDVNEAIEEVATSTTW